MNPTNQPHFHGLGPARARAGKRWPGALVPLGWVVLFASASGCGQPGHSHTFLQQSEGTDETRSGLPALLFSEYVEGSAYNKAVEIHNAGSSSAALGDCEVRLYTNGSATPSARIALPDIDLAPSATHVLCHTSFDQPSLCDQTSGLLYHSGNDAVELACSDATLDVIGQIGFDPGGCWQSGGVRTQDQTLRRTCGLAVGDRDGSDSFEPDVQWHNLPADTFSGLGKVCEDDPAADDDLQIGSADTFEIATWNIRNFPSSGTTVEKVAQLIKRMDLDVIAIQEVADEDAFGELLDSLPGYDGTLATWTYHWMDYYLKAGYIFRTGMVNLIQSQELFTNDWYSFPRPPFEAEFEILMPHSTAVTLVVIDLHLKSGSNADDRIRREKACGKLKDYTDNLLASGRANRVMMLGDFNDLLTDAPTYNIFSGFLNDTGNYQFMTAPLVAQKDYSIITSHRMIDHILVTTGLSSSLPAATTVTVPLDWAIGDYDYESDISDHRPVVSIFR